MNDKEKIIQRDSGFTFGCPECEYPPQHFTTQQQLDQHINKSHCKHKDEGMVKCSTCDDDERTWEEQEEQRMGLDDFEGRKD